MFGFSLFWSIIRLATFVYDTVDSRSAPLSRLRRRDGSVSEAAYLTSPERDLGTSFKAEEGLNETDL